MFNSQAAPIKTMNEEILTETHNFLVNKTEDDNTLDIIIIIKTSREIEKREEEKII